MRAFEGFDPGPGNTGTLMWKSVLQSHAVVIIVVKVVKCHKCTDRIVLPR